MQKSLFYARYLAKSWGWPKFLVAGFSYPPEHPVNLPGTSILQLRTQSPSYHFWVHHAFLCSPFCVSFHLPQEILFLLILCDSEKQISLEIEGVSGKGHSFPFLDKTVYPYPVSFVCVCGRLPFQTSKHLLGHVFLLTAADLGEHQSCTGCCILTSRGHAVMVRTNAYN